MDINIYNGDGTVLDVLSLPENVSHVSGRTSIGDSGIYYKGAGSFYNGHCVLNRSEYPEASPCDVFYYGWNVENPLWKGQFGIFRQRLQPYFSDFIGSCGPKESSIVSKSIDCPISNIEVLDYRDIPSLDNQRYYMLRYKNKREPWISYGLMVDFHRAVDTLIRSGWNFPWDKASIRDINIDGSVTDVADMFQSDRPIHKLGTVYSLLYSTKALNEQKFHTIMNSYGFRFKDDRDIVFGALAIMERSGIDTEFVIPKHFNDTWDIYYHIVKRFLLTGRNCGHVEDKDSGNNIALQYQKRFKKQTIMANSEKRFAA